MDPLSPEPSEGRAAPTRDLTPPHDAAILLAGRYRLDARVGQGGMAEVWSATDIQLDRKVAVKWLRPTLAADPVLAERFRREAVAVARLAHPHIVAVHDVVEHAGRQAVVMQFVDGKSLRQLLDSQRRLGPELTIHIGAAVAGALDEAHRKGFVHRDVKPGNIMITSDGRVLLTDFGIAKGLDAVGEDLTSDNVMMGTAKYLSPEQVRGRKLDGRADLYALGLVLYECLAGRVPFLGETDADTALARLQRDPTDLNRLRPTLPSGLVDLIHQTLARNPAHRPATGADLRAALMAVDTAPPPTERTPSTPMPRPRPSAGPGAGPHPATSSTTTTSAGPAGAGSRPDAAPARPRIPGEPVAGLDPRPRHRTPPAGTAIRGVPARGLQHSSRISLYVILALLGVAAVVAGVVWASLQTDSGDGLGLTRPDPVTSPTAPGGLAGETDGSDGETDATGGSGLTDEAGATGSPTTAAWGPAEIRTVTVWDPEGDGSGENDDQAMAALAGTAGEFWPTLCYSSQYLGAKDGVGLILTMSGPTAGIVNYTALHAPHWVEVFARPTTDMPASLADWGPSLTGTQYTMTPTEFSTEVPAGTASILIWVRELGRDSACSAARPFRGRIGNISFSSP